MGRAKELLVMSEGETKVATWSKKFKTLTYFDSRNTTVDVNCDSKKRAEAIIKNSKIEQELKVTP